ncbi:hypothetical protein C1646_476949 [Rhizophagus diaphanus]|nr:hypothetical protein C1646_476949 [Rhizophagus diaphanus] [Rhizophagus sp. MUCL 43196]
MRKGRTPEDDCATVDTTFYGINQECFLDYAFCKLSNNERPILPRIPWGTNVTINDFINNLGDGSRYCNVMKAGRETFVTRGVLRDKLSKFKPKGLSGSASALFVRGRGESFGANGDSGSPVFDDNGMLWGIVHGIHPITAVNETAVVPIVEILNHARNNFGGFALA